MPMAAEWTAERARALPDDGKRYEVLDGVLAVTPAPGWKHQHVVFALARQLDAYLRVNRLGRAIMAPADVEFSPTRLLEPDVFAIRDVLGRPAMDFGEVRHLLLAAEVLSPGTARHDRITKRRIYIEEGVGEYWIVDADARTIERWRPGQDRPEMIDATLRWEPAPSVPPLDLDVEALFAEALDT
ncbi:MAG: Uma2 family endonuclease [Gemmatimonadaceae bacterium]|nr:Uma2 family endonuclease [Gemmatimonadaceae bacterium]